jgi:hypothetical protein
MFSLRKRERESEGEGEGEGERRASEREGNGREGEVVRGRACMVKGVVYQRERENKHKGREERERERIEGDERRHAPLPVDFSCLVEGSKRLNMGAFFIISVVG